MAMWQDPGRGQGGQGGWQRAGAQAAQEPGHQLGRKSGPPACDQATCIGKEPLRTKTVERARASGGRRVQRSAASPGRVLPHGAMQLGALLCPALLSVDTSATPNVTHGWEFSGWPQDVLQSERHRTQLSPKHCVSLPTLLPKGPSAPCFSKGRVSVSPLPSIGLQTCEGQQAAGRISRVEGGGGLSSPQENGPIFKLVSNCI